MSVDVSQAIIALLNTTTAITDLVGTNIYFDRLPQPVSGPRAIAIWTIAATGHMDLGQPVGLDQDVMRFDSYALTRSDANEVGWEIWNALAGYSGVSAQVHIKGISRNSGVSTTTDGVKLGSDQYRFVATQDLIVSYDSLNLIGS